MKKKDIVKEAVDKAKDGIERAVENAVEDAKKKAIEPYIRKATESLLCKYTPDEIKEKTESLTSAIQDKKRFLGEKKFMQKQIDSKIEEADAAINRLSEEISTGKEMRAVNCEWHMNTPRPGRKQLHRLDNYELVRESDMSPADRQQTIDDDHPERSVEEKPIGEITDDPNDGRHQGEVASSETQETLEGAPV